MVYPDDVLRPFIFRKRSAQEVATACGQLTQIVVVRLQHCSSVRAYIVAMHGKGPRGRFFLPIGRRKITLFVVRNALTEDVKPIRIGSRPPIAAVAGRRDGKARKMGLRVVQPDAISRHLQSRQRV